MSFKHKFQDRKAPDQGTQLLAWFEEKLDSLDWINTKTFNAPSGSAFSWAAAKGVTPDDAWKGVMARITGTGKSWDEIRIRRQLDRAYQNITPKIPGKNTGAPRAPAAPKIPTEPNADRLQTVASLLKLDDVSGDPVRDLTNKFYKHSTEFPYTTSTEQFLQVLYPDEKVIAFIGDQRSQGDLIWNECNPGDFDELAHDNGVWFLPQPVDGEFKKNKEGKQSRRSEENVTAFRYMVLECDKCDPLDFQRLLLQLPLPIVAIYTSGGKSIHALVQVNAASKAEWDEYVVPLKPALAAMGVDPAALSAVRLTRLPGCMRGDKEQQLLYLNPGNIGPIADCPASESDPDQVAEQTPDMIFHRFRQWIEEVWENEEIEAEDEDDDDLPDLEDWDALEEEDIPDPPQTIEGIIYQGGKLVYGGGSKSFKTWSLMALAFAVASGKQWMGFNTTKGKVVYINFEVRKFAFRKRGLSMRKALSIEGKIPNLKHLNLRGKARDFDMLLPMLRKRLIGQDIALIIVDPIYKTLGRRNENDSSDMADLFNKIEALAEETGATVAFAAHFSKGNQAMKDPMDRISGSGTFGRDPDAILVATKHENEESYTISSSLRDLPPQPEFVVRWEYPLMIRDNEADPTKLKQIGGNQKEEAEIDLSEMVDLLELERGGMKSSEWQRACKDHLGISAASFYRYLKLVKKEDAATCFQGRWYKPGMQMQVVNVPEYKASTVLKYYQAGSTKEVTPEDAWRGYTKHEPVEPISKKDFLKIHRDLAELGLIKQTESNRWTRTERGEGTL